MMKGFVVTVRSDELVELIDKQRNSLITAIEKMPSERYWRRKLWALDFFAKHLVNDSSYELDLEELTELLSPYSLA